MFLALVKDWFCSCFCPLGNVTPDVLRDIPNINSGPSEPLNPTPAARALPVHHPVITVEPKRAGEEVAGRQLESDQKGSEHFSMVAQPSVAERGDGPVKAFTAPKFEPPVWIETSTATLQPSPPPRTAVPEKATLVLTAPSKPAPSKPAPPKMAPNSRPAQTIAVAKKPVATYDMEPKELTPDLSPVEMLELSLSLISSTEWEEKTKGLQHIQALAQQESHALMEELPAVCRAVIAEVKNLRSSVATEAMDTIEDLHVFLETGMDKFAEDTGAALLQKIAQSSGSKFLREKSSRTLNALVQFCSPDQVLKVLLSPGLSHLSAAVRACAAEKLHMLADSLGASEIMTAKKSFTMTFVTAVNKMSVDAAADVRHHGLAILSEIALEPAFKTVWLRVINDKDRRQMEKILIKMGVR